MLTRALLLSLAVSLANGVWACELCAIYNADSAASGSGKGFSFAVSEQYIPYGTVQLNGRQLPPSILDQTFVNTSMTHFVPTDRKSTRLNSSHLVISYAVFCLKK